MTDSWVTMALGTGNTSRSVLTYAVQCVSQITTCVQIADTNPSVTFTGQLSDVSQVEKFELSEEAYAQRNGNSTLICPQRPDVVFLNISLQTPSSRTNNAKNLDALQRGQMKNHKKLKRMLTSK